MSAWQTCCALRVGDVAATAIVTACIQVSTEPTSTWRTGLIR